MVRKFRRTRKKRGGGIILSKLGFSTEEQRTPPTIDYFKKGVGAEYYNDVADFIRILEGEGTVMDAARDMNKTSRQLAHIIVLSAYFPTMDISKPQPGAEWTQLFTMRNRYTNPTGNVLPNPEKYYEKSGGRKKRRRTKKRRRKRRKKTRKRRRKRSKRRRR